MRIHKKHRIVLVLAIAALQSFLTAGPSQGAITSYFSGPNRLFSVDYLDGSLAIGSEQGLFVFRDGITQHVGAADGLPEETVRNVVFQDSLTLFLGPTVQNDVWRFHRVRLLEPGMDVTDICPDDPPFSFGSSSIWFWHQMAQIGLDGSLWVGDQVGLRKFYAGEWTTYPWPDEFTYKYGGDLCITDDGVIWGILRTIDMRNHFFRFAPGTSVGPDGGWTVFRHAFQVSAVQVALDGVVWLISSTPEGLWRYDGEVWELISYNPIWGFDTYTHTGERFHKMLFDEEGTLYALGSHSLLMWDGGFPDVIEEASGFHFKCTASRFFTAGAVMPDTGVLLCTYGSGLLIHNDGVFSVNYQAGPPGDFTCIITEDADGSIMVNDRETHLFGKLHEGLWNHMAAGWLPISASDRTSTTDIDGSLWFPAEEGAVHISGGQVEQYDGTNSPLGLASAPVTDREGVKWFRKGFWEYPPECQIVSFDGLSWTEYPNREYFGFESKVSAVTVGPNDAKYFLGTMPCAVYDGVEWDYFTWDDMPPWDWYLGSAILHFDLEGHAIFHGSAGVCIGDFGGRWDRVYNEAVRDLALDAAGMIWLGTEEGLLSWDRHIWETTDVDDGLSNNAVTVITIDHNGDKWVGTEHGLNRIEDGGAAQQKLELAVDETPDGFITVNGTFTNAGAVIPVLLWFALEVDGALYYYPAWGSAPDGTRRVLGAYSIETEELLRLDTSTLQAGDYTFYGGISLLGGIDLLIGPRKDKITVATYHKD